MLIGPRDSRLAPVGTGYSPFADVGARGAAGRSRSRRGTTHDGEHAFHTASHHATADRRSSVAALDLQLHLPARQQTQRRFDQRPMRRDVDDRRFVSRAHPRLKDAEFATADVRAARRRSVRDRRLESIGRFRDELQYASFSGFAVYAHHVLAHPAGRGCTGCRRWRCRWA